MKNPDYRSPDHGTSTAISVDSRRPSHPRLSAGLSSLRGSLAQRALLTALSVTGFASLQGCLPDTYSDATVQEKIAAAHAHDDTGNSADGNGTDNIEPDAKDGNIDVNGSDENDTADATDGSTDDTADGVTDDTADATDGSTDDSADGVTDDTADATDDSADGVTDDTADATDGSTDDSADGVTDDTADATDGSTDDAADGVTDDVADASDGSTDDTADATDGSTDDSADAEDVGTDVNDVADADDGGTDTNDAADVKDGDTDDTGPDTQDVPDVQAPKTCDGKPVGAIKTFYSGPKGTQGNAPCSPGVEICGPDGQWGIVNPEITPADSDPCDGIDNDCDGITDPDNTSYLGPFGTEGIGICQPQILKCQGDQYALKQSEIQPAAEKCNGLDDNCNGVTDEGFYVDTFSGDAVNKNKGICKDQIADCVNGVIQITKPEVLPTSEKCNGLDDNCDGVTDEGFKVETFSGNAVNKGKGICKNKITDCINGVLGIITQNEVLPAAQEICGNGLDDNCDGVTDEAPCDCDPDGDGIINDQFKDPNLLAAMQKDLGQGPNYQITLADAINTTEIKVGAANITDLTGVECFPNLVHLDASNNPLSGIPQLQWPQKMTDIWLDHDGLKDFSPIIENPKFGKGTTLTAIYGNFMPNGQYEAIKAKGIKLF